MSFVSLSPECNAWAISEKAWRRTVSRADIKETKILLDDLCIFTTIPCFDTVSQLLRWRAAIIDEVFSQQLGAERQCANRRKE